MYSVYGNGIKGYDIPIDPWPRKREVIPYDNTVKFQADEPEIFDPYKKADYGQIKNPIMYTLPHRGKLTDEPIQPVFDEPERDFKDISSEFVRFTGDRKLSEIIAELKLIKPTAEPKKSLELMIDLIKARKEDINNNDLSTIGKKATELPISSYAEEFGKRIIDQAMWRSQYPQIIIYLLSRFPSTSDGFTTRFINDDGKMTNPQLQTMMRRMFSGNTHYLDLASNTLYSEYSVMGVVGYINPALLPDSLRYKFLDDRLDDRLDDKMPPLEDAPLPPIDKPVKDEKDRKE